MTAEGRRGQCLTEPAIWSRQGPRLSMVEQRSRVVALSHAGCTSQNTKPSRSKTSPIVTSIGEENPGTVIDERMELPMLATRIGLVWKISEQARIEEPPGK